MKKISFILFAAVLLAQYSIAQKETFDIITYTPPKDWKKNTKQGVVMYTSTNAATGGFCMLAMYASVPGLGDAQNDFKKEWKDLAATPYKITQDPAPETQATADGWTVVTAAAPTLLDSVDAYVVLTVFSGFNKIASVLVVSNDKAYLSQVDALLESMELNKTTAVQKNNVPVNQTAPAVQHFGHMIYTPLENWKLQQFTNGAILTPNDIPDDEYLELRIMAASPFSGSLPQALAGTWNEALQQLVLTPLFTPSYAVETEKRSYKGWNYIKASGLVKNDKGDQYRLYLFVIQLEDRIERVAILSIVKRRPDNSSGYYRTWYENPGYQDKINSFLFSVQFDDRKEPVYANGRLNGNGIAGLYVGLRMNAADGAGLQGTYAVLFSNGQVYYRDKLPSTGFDGKDTWVEAEWNIRNWGRYDWQNGKGLLKFGYGNIPARISGNDLILTTQNTEHAYMKVPSVDGAVFNGTYAFDGNWGTDSHPDRKPPSIIFTADKRFTDNGALKILGHAGDGPFDVTAQPGSGTYEIRNYTILFTYSDGRKLQIAFSGLNYDRKNQSPATLVLSFNNDVLLKK